MGKRRDEFEEKKRCVYIKQDEIREIREGFELNNRCVGENKNCMCFDAAHVHYSYSTRSAPQFYERTSSAERVMNVGTTRDELREYKEKRWEETGSNVELKREGGTKCAQNRK